MHYSPQDWGKDPECTVCNLPIGFDEDWEGDRREGAQHRSAPKGCVKAIGRELSKLLKERETRPIGQTPRDLIMALGQLSFDEEYQISFICPPTPMAFLLKEVIDHPSFHIMLTQGDTIIRLN